MGTAKRYPWRNRGWGKKVPEISVSFSDIVSLQLTVHHAREHRIIYFVSMHTNMG
jgi:hypothetical protein